MMRRAKDQSDDSKVRILLFNSEYIEKLELRFEEKQLQSGVTTNRESERHQIPQPFLTFND